MKLKLNINKELFILALLYLIQGIPIYFFTLGLPTILRNQGLHLDTIGLFSLLGIPWAIKFLWAPMVDHYHLPIIGRMTGKRKSWILPLQVLISLAFFVLSYFPLSFSQPMFPIFFLGIFITLFGATQDIAIDAYAVETLSQKEKGMGNAMQGIGAGLGALLGGSFVLYCFEVKGWIFALRILSLLTLVPFIILIFLPLKENFNNNKNNDKDINKNNRPALKLFFKRREVKWILLTCFVFRFTEGLLMGIQGPYLVDLQFTPSQIGLYIGVIGGVIGPLITLWTGFILKQKESSQVLLYLSRVKVFLYFGLFLTFSFQLHHQFSLTLILSHLILRYMILVALYTFFMKHCSLSQAGTDFAIMGGFDIVFYMMATSCSGLMAEALGMEYFFFIMTSLATVGMIILPILLKKIQQQDVPISQLEIESSLS